ncbi:MAG: J domain-containing protein [Candidatus Saganbacteria bacterium]|nr:J domain-containing protein [Candidatus Saganbacteria bacterium]
MTAPSFAEVDQARKVLGLGDKADLAEVKRAQRRLVKEWHPDKRRKAEQAECHEKMKEINRAYKIIMKYIENYRYDFVESKVSEDDPIARWKAQFGDDPTWGTGKGWS